MIIDGGAYDGDTAIPFSNCLQGRGKLFCFEPDELNYARLVENIAAAGLTETCMPVKAGLWSERTSLSFQNEGIPGSKVLETEGESFSIEALDLDSFAFDRKIRPDLIKLDVEGAELKALQGAESCIRTYKPKLQICIYHKLQDLWEIYEQIQAYHAGYRFFVGHHLENGACSYAETILYAC